jgi:hypothetical protein
MPPRSSANETLFAFPLESKCQRNYFPPTCYFGTYFRQPCDSILLLDVEVAATQLEKEGSLVTVPARRGRLMVSRKED